MSEQQLDVADMQCWIFRMRNPNGICHPVTALNYSKSMISLDLSLKISTRKMVRYGFTSFTMIQTY